MCSHGLYLEEVRGHFSNPQRLPGGGDGLQEEAENGSLGEGEEGVCRGRETEAGRLRGLLGTASISG